MKKNNNLLTFIENEKKMLEASESLKKAEKEIGHIDGEIIGTGRSDYTCSATEYNLNIKGKNFSLIDIPGIEGNESKFKSIIQKSLEKAHIIFFVNGSGKKIEKGTLEKIKDYMKDGTSVYTVFNVHCKPKKNRVKGIDRSYSEDLKIAYYQQQEIVIQTKDNLKFLGDNYKGSICVNGLLAFCAEAYQGQNSKTSSIVIDEGKSLLNDQKKYAKEYSDNIPEMISDSRISLITDIIEQYILTFEETICDENIKKIKSRFDSTLDKLNALRKIEFKKYNEWQKNYNVLESQCEDAREDFGKSIGAISGNVVNEVFTDAETDLLNLVGNECTLKNVDIIVKEYFDNHKDEIESKLKRKIQDKITAAINKFYEDVDDLIKRTDEDNIDAQKGFAESIDKWTFDFNENALPERKTNFKEAFKHLSRIGEMAFSGFSMGTAFPGIGNVVGTILGAIAGLAISIWSVFLTRKKRNDLVSNIIETYIERVKIEETIIINEKIKSENFEEKFIKPVCDRISELVQIRNNSINHVKEILNKLVFDIYKEKIKII